MPKPDYHSFGSALLMAISLCQYLFFETLSNQKLEVGKNKKY